MKKRLFSLFLALLLVLFPVRASPAPATLEEGGGYNGYNPRPTTLTYPVFSTHLQRSSVLPQSYRSASVTAVRDQGQNGLCWAFTAMAGVEANIIKNEAAVNPGLSPLHLAYATSNRNGNISHGFNRTPDDGGNREMATAYLMRGHLQGTVDERHDPYGTFNRNPIPGTRALSVTQGRLRNFTVQNVLFLGDTKNDISPNRIKEAVMTYGSVPCSMHWDGSGVSQGNSSTASYNAATYAFFYNGRQIVNHAITLVGWDDNFPRERFNANRRPRGNGAWLAKNSWGTQWGDGGYFWISYEDTVAPAYLWVIDGVKPFDPDARVYEYDPHGYGGDMFFRGLSTIHGANVFTVASGRESLREVKFFVPTPDTTVSVYITPNYTGTLAVRPAELVLANHRTTWPGWYTFTLDNAVPLGAAGSMFAVIVRYTTQRGDAMVPRNTSTRDFTPSAVRNVSYISHNGSMWQHQTDANINIKAVTSMNTAAPNIGTASPWAAAGLNAAFTRGLIPSAQQGNYQTRVCTRAEYCALAVRMIETLTGREITQRRIFDDDRGDVNIRKIGGLGIVAGKGGNRFAPDDPITREESAVFVQRTIQLGLGIPLTARGAAFSDIGGAADWARDAISLMRGSDIMRGRGSNIFAPKETYTREESILTMMNIWNFYFW
jgi:C1A family cysteine protease